jgi:hypothetical protein
MFRLKRPIEDAPIPVGARGAILDVYGGSPCAYEVEFPDGSGGNLNGTMTFAITEDFMEPDG